MKYLFLLCLLLVACNPDNVQFDEESPSFVDGGTKVGIDTGLPEDPSEAIVNESHEDFVPPPQEESITYNGDVQSADVPEQLRGRSLVTLWAWNEHGSQRLLISEGMGAGVPRLKGTIEVGAVTSEDGGKAVVSFNGLPGRIMREREETRFNNTWVFISEIVAVN